MQGHGLHKGIFISRTLYHSHAINVELSGDTMPGRPNASGPQMQQHGVWDVPQMRRHHLATRYPAAASQARLM